MARSRKKRDIAREIIDGLDEVRKDRNGQRAALVAYEVRVPDVRAIRRRFRLTQAEFARRFHLNKRTVQDWEQGRVSPEPAVRAYLMVIARAPRAVERALKQA